MTWTVFEHHVGRNETTDEAPGRGGYKYVLFDGPIEEALWWWTWHYSSDPQRRCSYPEHTGEPVWKIETMSEEGARHVVGEKTVMEGGVGVEETEPYTWSELNGRLDVNVVKDP